ncbi:Cytochrome P450 3A4 [Branchiostoma belcheri]|nr:Cytochrome P450 3A4 [Branchiostoma belcheri]
MFELLPFSSSWGLVGLFAVLLYMYLVWPYSTFKKLGIPGPNPVVLFGNYLSYGKVGNLVKASGEELMQPRAEPAPTAIDWTPGYSFQVKSAECFVGQGETLSGGLFGTKDADWKRVRSAITPTFSSGKLKQMAAHIERCADGFVSNLAEKAEQGTEFDLMEFSGAFAMDAISSTAFGVELDSLHNPNHPFVTNAKAVFDVSFFNPVTVILCRQDSGASWGDPVSAGADKIFGEAVDNVIDMRGSNNEGAKPADFLQLMLKSHNEDLDKEVPSNIIKHGVSKKEIKANAVLFWAAGYDTTANTISLTAYNLALNQEAQDKVIQELDSVIDKRGRIDYESVQEMPYLEMCINETLRLFPAAQRIDRVCKEDTDVKGLHIPAGTVVNVPVWAIHHDADIWPEPETFKPESRGSYVPDKELVYLRANRQTLNRDGGRHRLSGTYDPLRVSNVTSRKLQFTKEEKEARDAYAFLPFGSGPRNCVGMRLAMLELKFVLAKALEKFRFVTCDKTVIPVRIKNTLANQIDGRLWLKVEARASAI